VRARSRAETSPHLQHGEKLAFDVEIRSGVFPWNELHPNWWFWLRPSFYVFTTLGVACKKKVGLKTLRQMKNLLDALRSAIKASIPSIKSVLWDCARHHGSA
jgi:hypothetical protein